MPKTILNIVLNALAVICTCLATVEGNRYAGNLIMFWCGMHAIIALGVFASSNEVRGSIAEKIKTPAWFSYLMDGACVLFLAGFGWFWCASAMMAGLIASVLIYDAKGAK